MSEIKFLPVTEFPWLLACSEGYLVNSRTGNIIKGSVKKSGYVEVCIIGNNKINYRLLHRLIAEAFCCQELGCDEVNHKDGNKENNKAYNLEWVNHADNLRHAYETKLRKDDVSPKAVRAVNMNSGEEMTFSSIYKAARFLGISNGNICMCCKGQRPYAGGFIWEYIDEN